MADYATTADVAARWRPLSAAESTVAAALLADASAILRARAPSIDDRLTEATLDPALPRSVAVQMVLRVLRNPDGLVSEQIDDYGIRRADSAAGSLTVTDDELALLTEAPGSGAAFTVYPAYTPGWGSTDDDWT